MRKKDFTGRNKPRSHRARPRGRGDWPGYDAVRDQDGFRSRRLASERQEKRGRRARLIFTLGIIAAAVVFVAVFFIIRASGHGESEIVSPLIVDDPGSGNVILMQKDASGRLAQILVLAGSGDGGYGLLTIPARTVVETPTAGFQRLDNLLENSGQALLDQSVANLLQIPIRYHVAFNQDALAPLMEVSGIGSASSIPAIDGSQDSPKNQAAFFVGLHDALAARPEADRQRLAAELPAKVQTDMDSNDLTRLFITVTTPGRAFAASPLPVKVAGSGSSWYFEPAIGELGPLTPDEGADAAIQMEIRNGIEVNGIVEAAATRLEGLHYATSLTPDLSGANYEITQIRCGPEAVSAGNQVRELLGGGNVIKDDAMEKRQIIVIIGKDLSVALTGQN